MSNRISLLVGLKNNLIYSKNFYHTTRSLYPNTEIVFVSYGSTDGTHDWLDSLTDSNVVHFYAQEQKTFSETYNKCNQLATKEHVVYVHNDMVLTPGFLEKIEPYLSETSAIAYTVIEPPIFAGDERPNKLIRDFGEDIETLTVDKLYDFTRTVKNNNELLSYDEGVSFFLCLPRKLLLETGGLDPLFNPMFCEDDDLVLRLRLMGIQFYILTSAMCYHFVSKTSRFSEEYQHRTKEIEENSNKNFIRKWGFRLSSPIKKKYDIGFIIENCTNEILAQIEPYSTNVYVDIDPNQYIQNEQPKTKIDLNTRVKPIKFHKNNDVLISLNGKNFTNTTYNIVKHLNEIITTRANTKLNLFERLTGKSILKFKKDILHINIHTLRTLEHSLIHLK
jgi:GT2 family glycosyltransferase